MSPTDSRHWQLQPAVRLRRERWGGIAFQRTTGDLLEVDEEAFAVLVHLLRPRTLVGLRDVLRERSHPARLPELAALLNSLENRNVIQQVTADRPALPDDPWATGPFTDTACGLRAPLVAHWAVTYRCNLQCAFCYSESGPWRPTGPDVEVRRRIIERLAAWGVLEVALGGGEPLVLPDFPALLAAIRMAGMVPNVTTNGTFLPPTHLRALADHAGVVQLSADRPELLDEARGARVFQRLERTALLLRKAGVRLGLNLLLTPDNISDIRRSLVTALELGVEGVTFLRPKGAWAARHWPGFPSPRDFDRMAVDLKAFLRSRPPLRLYVDTALRAEWSQWGLLEDPEPDVLGCGGGQRHVAVNPDGDVYPCSHLRRAEYGMGNILHDDPAVIWTEGKGRAGRVLYLDQCCGVRCPCLHEALEPPVPLQPSYRAGGG